jgi:hypothetical protein
MGLKEDCKAAYEEAQAAVIFSSNRGGKLKDACAAYEKVVKAKDQKNYKAARKALEEALKSAQEAYDKKVIEANRSATQGVLDANNTYGKDAVKKDPNCSKVMGKLEEALKLRDGLKKIIDYAQKVYKTQTL